MNKQNSIPQPLTKDEAKELKALSERIFQGAMFIVISEEERKQPHVQRYEELLTKKMKYIQYVYVSPVLN